MNVNEPNDTTTPANFSLDFKHPLYARRFDLNKATNQMPPLYLASYITTFELNWIVKNVQGLHTRIG